MLLSKSKMRIVNLQPRMVLFQQQPQLNHRISNTTAATTMMQAQRYHAKIVPAIARRMMMKMMSTMTTETIANSAILVSRRPPTPPMPRINYYVVFDTNKSTFYGAFKSWWDSGTILIIAGFSILSLTVIDLYLQGYGLNYYYDVFLQGTVPALMNKDELIHEIINNAKQQRQFLYDQYSNTPLIYQCKVVKYYKMSGSHGLYNIKLNDVVDVLVEQVGPQQLYHLCRFVHRPSDEDNVDTNDTDRIIVKNENGDIIELGWYPITHLEKINMQQSKSWWKRLLFVA
jgi:hypothetical protein